MTVLPKLPVKSPQESAQTDSSSMTQLTVIATAVPIHNLITLPQIMDCMKLYKIPQAINHTTMDLV
jgi:hypothetical protein